MSLVIDHCWANRHILSNEGQMDSIHIPYPSNQLNRLKVPALSLGQQELNIHPNYQDSYNFSLKYWMWILISLYLPCFYIYVLINFVSLTRVFMCAVKGTKLYGLRIKKKSLIARERDRNIIQMILGFLS